MHARMHTHTHMHTHAPLGFIVWFDLLGAKNNTEIPQRPGSVTQSNVNTFEDKGVWTHRTRIGHEKPFVLGAQKENNTKNVNEK